MALISLILMLLTMPTTTVSSYQSTFDTVESQQDMALTTMAASGDSLQYYTLAYALNAEISMYEATGNTKYIEKALDWEEAMVAKATVVDAEGARNWTGTWATSYSPTPITQVLYEIQGTTELARLSRLILTTPALGAYQRRAYPIFQFVRSDIVLKNLCTRGQSYDLQAGLSMSDKTALFIRLVNDLVQVDPTMSCNGVLYTTILTRWATQFHSRLSPLGTGLVWDEGMPWYPQYTAPDTSHGNRYPYAAVELYSRGIIFTSQDIIGLSNLLVNTIWNQSLSSPQFTNIIDGSNPTFYNCPVPANCSPGRAPWGEGLIYFGWIMLGGYSSQVQAVGDATLKALLANVKNPSLNYYDFYAELELSSNLAKNINTYKTAGIQ